jgi:hypothetical protein
MWTRVGNQLDIAQRGVAFLCFAAVMVEIFANIERSL